MNTQVVAVNKSTTAPAPAPTDVLLRLGGYRWIPEYIYWGEPGRAKSGMLTGYNSKQVGRGRPTKEETERKTIDFWNVEAIYALFDRNTPIYVGEGVLRDRLWRHYTDQDKAGRWDSFSWLSPWTIEDDGTNKPNLVAWTDKAVVQMTGKRLVEVFEMAIIILSLPQMNSQLPDDNGKISWITQVPHKDAELTDADKLKNALKALAEIKGMLPTQPTAALPAGDIGARPCANGR